MHTNSYDHVEPQKSHTQIRQAIWTYKSYKNQYTTQSTNFCSVFKTQIKQIERLIQALKPK